MQPMFKTGRALVSTAVAAALFIATAAEVVAAPTPVAPGHDAAVAVADAGAVQKVEYRRRYGRRHGGHFDAGGALALGVIGLGVAAIIASTQHRRRYYGEPAYGYDSGYDEQPEYTQPQVIYAPRQPYYPDADYQQRPRYRYFQHGRRDHGDGDGDSDGRRWHEPRDRPVAYQPPTTASPRYNLPRTGWPGRIGGPYACQPGQLCGPQR